MLLQFSWQVALAAPDAGNASGTVADETGEPLIGATVMVKGTSNGNSTDVDGNFSLNNVKDGATLVISYVGMEPEEQRPHAQ